MGDSVVPRWSTLCRGSGAEGTPRNPLHPAQRGPCLARDEISQIFVRFQTLCFGF